MSTRTPTKVNTTPLGEQRYSPPARPSRPPSRSTPLTIATRSKLSPHKGHRYGPSYLPSPPDSAASTPEKMADAATFALKTITRARSRARAGSSTEVPTDMVTKENPQASTMVAYRSRRDNFRASVRKQSKANNSVREQSMTDNSVRKQTTTDNFPSRQYVAKLSAIAAQPALFNPAEPTPPLSSHSSQSIPGHLASGMIQHTVYNGPFIHPLVTVLDAKIEITRSRTRRLVELNQSLVDQKIRLLAKKHEYDAMLLEIEEMMFHQYTSSSGGAAVARTDNVDAVSATCDGGAPRLDKGKGRAIENIDEEAAPAVMDHSAPICEPSVRRSHKQANVHRHENLLALCEPTAVTARTSIDTDHATSDLYGSTSINTGLRGRIKLLLSATMSKLSLTCEDRGSEPVPTSEAMRQECTMSMTRLAKARQAEERSAH